jgi:hypothetical protein
MNIKMSDYIEFLEKYSIYNDKEIIYKIYLEKNVKIKFEIFYNDIMSKYKHRLDIIEALWEEKTKCIRKFKTILFLEIKKDYIEKYGIIKYLVEEQYIKEDIYNEIKRQENMLWEWNL